MMCSNIFVKATSSNNDIIDSNGLIVGGTYPNCTLRIAPKTYKYGIVDITVTLYDFWTYATAKFQLNVIHILAPGAFAIVDAEGGNQYVDLTWQHAPYMLTTGAYTSPYYTVFYRQHSPQTPWTSIPRVTSPYMVTGLTNGVEYDFYVLATNSIGTRASNTVIAEPTRFQYRGAAFVAGTNQGEESDGLAMNKQHTNMALLHDTQDETDTNYVTICTGPGAPDARCPAAGPAAFYASATPTGSIEDPTPAAGTEPPSYLLSPSGKYKVYVNSQSNILSGVGQ